VNILIYCFYWVVILIILRLPEDDADALKLVVGVLVINKIVVMYILCICWSG